jgi:hypothetical protein
LKGATYSDSGKYKFEVKLEDSRGASQIEIVYYDVQISDLSELSFKDTSELKNKDFNFNINAWPDCFDLVRVHSVEASFNCTLNTPENIEKEDIWLNMIEPAVVINMPTEEYYSKINPEIGFKYITGTILGVEIDKAFSER